MSVLYASLVHPHLDYASNIWNPHLLEYTRTIEKIQRMATNHLNNISYHERLSSLDLIMTYKILHGTVYRSKDHFFLIIRYVST